MKIECEIDWFDDDESTIDDAVRDAIIQQTVTRLVKGKYDELEKQVSTKLATEIDELMLKLTERFMNREIVVTDNWGDVQEKHESVNELLKSKFDEFMTMSVDKKGAPTSSCSYGRAQPRTRVEHLIDARINAFSAEMTKSIASVMDTKLKAAKAKFMAEAGARMADKLGLIKFD